MNNPAHLRPSPQISNNVSTPRKTVGAEILATPPQRSNSQSVPRTPDTIDIPIIPSPPSMSQHTPSNQLSQTQPTLSSSPPYSQEPPLRPLFTSESDPLDSSGGLGARAKLATEDVTADEQGLRRLMKAGSWRAVLKLADKCISSTDNPRTVLQFKLCRIVSLVKMRMYKNALDEINGIGDFDGPTNCYEQYTQFQGRKGSMVPFCMRVLKAELLFLLGSDQSLDPLHDLLGYCRSNIDNLKKYSTNVNIGAHAEGLRTFPKPAAVGHTLTDDDAFDSNNLDHNNVSIWQIREHRLIFQIATHLITQKDYLLAITMLENIALRYPNNVSIISALGRVHLQMGNTAAASVMFKKAEQLVEDPENSGLVLMNRGYLHLSTEQYKLAIESFESVLKIQPSNIAAANNRSVCWLYTCDLSKAILSLEEIIQRDPENNLDESLIFNLCTLYDLASDRSADKKKNIMALVAKFASDSFDFRVLKINTN
jgi:hypothetical protein